MNSRAKYEELKQEPDFIQHTAQQRSVAIITEILQTSQRNNTTDHLLVNVLNISNESPNLSPVLVFQIAADVTKVDSVCNN